MGKEAETWAGAAPTYANVVPPGDPFPSAFPTPELRTVSRGFSLHQSSMWLSAAFPIPSLVVRHQAPILACGRIRRATTRRFTAHTHALLDPRRIRQRTIRVSPLCRPAVPIHAPAVAERGR